MIHLVFTIIEAYIAVMCLISTGGWIYERYFLILDPKFGRPGIGELIVVYWVNAVLFPHQEIEILMDYWINR